MESLCFYQPSTPSPSKDLQANPRQHWQPISGQSCISTPGHIQTPLTLMGVFQIKICSASWKLRVWFLPRLLPMANSAKMLKIAQNSLNLVLSKVFIPLKNTENPLTSRSVPLITKQNWSAFYISGTTWIGLLKSRCLRSHHNQKLTLCSKAPACRWEKPSRPDCLYLKGEKLITGNDISKIIGLFQPDKGIRWARKAGIKETKSGHRIYFYFHEFEKAIIKMLPDHFPFLNPETNLNYSQALGCRK